MTLREALLETTRSLERHGVSNPRLSAEVLLAHCLSVDRTYLYTHDDRTLDPDARQRLDEAVYDRISGVPVQYIVGRQEFYGRYFSVNPAVLIPRPETEFVVEAVLELEPPAGAAIVDVGAGSGCIGLTLALEIPHARVLIADVSHDALRVARANALQLGAAASFVCMDLLDAVASNAATFDFIVSNPPYVSPAETSKLQREVREHEPHVALFAPEEGLGIFRHLIPAAASRLKPGGHLIMEIGFGMEGRITGLLDSRWVKLPTKADLQGIPRVVIARLSYGLGR